MAATLSRMLSSEQLPGSICPGGRAASGVSGRGSAASVDGVKHANLPKGVEGCGSGQRLDGQVGCASDRWIGSVWHMVWQSEVRSSSGGVAWYAALKCGVHGAEVQVSVAAATEVRQGGRYMCPCLCVIARVFVPSHMQARVRARIHAFVSAGMRGVVVCACICVDVHALTCAPADSKPPCMCGTPAPGTPCGCGRSMPGGVGETMPPPPLGPPNGMPPGTGDGTPGMPICVGIPGPGGSGGMPICVGIPGPGGGGGTPTCVGMPGPGGGGGMPA
eukprot:271754-Chlamydomonas_euryale.AAC.9